MGQVGYRDQGKLSQDRIARLNALDFPWRRHDVTWDKWIAKLVAFKEANGHCNVPQSYGDLGKWCGNVRAIKKGTKRGSITPERVAQLDALGFLWDPPAYPQHDDFWDKTFAKLAAFKEANGHCNVTRSMDGPLGSWCYSQRQRRKHGKLSQERIAKLDALGFRW